MENKIEVKKGKVIKNIDVKLLSDYLNMGWIKVEPNFEIKATRKLIKEISKDI